VTNLADPDALRARATALRSLAARLDASVLHDLPAAAGDDTWRGPTADAFVADAHRARRRCDDASAALRAAARALESDAAHASPAR
jgi:hypothetical protein